MPSMIKKADGSYDPVVVEEEIYRYWKENDIYKKLKMLRSDGEKVYFLDGPPYTTGNIHVGTALNKSIKDARIRYLRMNGFNVRDQPGWDMHGLPIEVNVEKSFNLRNKKEIEEIGIEKFVNECRKYALSNLNNMTQQFVRLGVWMDWERPYMTISKSFTEAAWSLLKEADSKGLLFEGEMSTQWCYRCGTALADAEIEYEDRTDPSIYVKFKIKNSEDYLLIWTTTPWTLPANMAVAVHPDMNYSLVEYRKEGVARQRVYVLEEKAEEIGGLTGQEEYEIIRTLKGKEMEGISYDYPLESFSRKGRESEWAWKVILSDTVEVENTGLVHIAPGHGSEDFELGKRYGIEAYSPVNEEGAFVRGTGRELEGKNVISANGLIMDELNRRGLLYFSSEIKHRYGTCWRCHSPLIYRATRQWYLRTSSLKEKMVDEIFRIRWIPEWAGSSRQAEWARNLKDWCITRQRFWGTPMPVWRCDGCGRTRIVGGTEELAGSKGYTDGMDLHRPQIDAVTLECEKCSATMKRVPDVLDVWIDSGICSWASLNYPQEKTELETWWPGKWITEAGDQTRGWFNSQLSTSLIVFGRSPFESALLHGWVNDAKGRPMHKSKGNVVDPMEQIQKEGADSLRLYLLSSRAPWEDLSFQPDGPRNARRVLNIFWNVYNFASTYMALDSFSPVKVEWKELLPRLSVEDRWLLSVMQRTVNEVSEFMEAFELQKACRSIEQFITEDLSRWYVRLARERTWMEEQNDAKTNTYCVLHYVLDTTARLLAPFTPYLSDYIYRAMNPDALSVHMSKWPELLNEMRDESLERDMKVAREIVEAVLKARQETGVKLRWPLPRLVIKPKGGEERKSIGRMMNIIERQSNVKSSRLLTPDTEWEELILTVMPNPNAIGKVYRQWAGKIAIMLKARPAAEIIKGIRSGSYTLGIEGQTIKIEENMVSLGYSLPPNVAGVEFSAGTVYIDFNMDRSLELEALSREVMRRIQKMRKDLGMRVDEFVTAEVSASGMVLESVLEWKSTIMSECRLSDLKIVEEVRVEGREEWLIDENRLAVALQREGMKPAGTPSSVPAGTEVQMAKEREDAENILMEPGSTYVIFEEFPEKSFNILSETIRNGVDVLCLAREFPERLRKKYDLGQAEIIWLSSVGNEDSIRPTDLEKISLTISDFFKEKKGIAFIDGIEYLISNNGFNSVVKLIQHMRDVAAKTGSILMFSINSQALSQNDISLIRKEVDAVI